MNDTEMQRLRECFKRIHLAAERLQEAASDATQTFAKCTAAIHDFGNTAASLHVLSRMGKGGEG